MFVVSHKSREHKETKLCLTTAMAQTELWLQHNGGEQVGVCNMKNVNCLIHQNCQRHQRFLKRNSSCSYCKYRIESQEHRLQKNSQLNGPQHPRAATNDDVECFISCIRNDLGDTFTVKNLSQRWPIICREITKHIDISLPFYYWSSKHNRFR